MDSFGHNKQSGFTLVEMALVLAVIGLILGAVSIGKDVQRNADYAKIANKFVFDWKKAYDGYYQRTGGVLGDCQQAPTLMVNGSETTFAGQPACTRAGGSNVAGLPENFGNTGLRIGHGLGYAQNSVGAGDPKMALQDLRDLMQRAGIRMPPGRGEGMEDRYLYTDSNGNATELQIAFQWNPPGTISGAGNVMVLRGLTPDLARYLDQTIDGKPDARMGRFRIQNAAANTSDPRGNAPGDQWQGNNTFSQAQAASVGPGNTAAATGTGQNLDENRVVLLTAQWALEE